MTEIEQITIPLIGCLISPETYPNLYHAFSYIQIESIIWYLVIFILQSFAHNPLLSNDYVHEYEAVKKSKLTIEDLDPAIKKRKSIMLSISEDDVEWHKNHKAISINGYWYDVTNFISSHPGGRIIEDYIGKEATASFYGMHCNADVILKQRFPAAIHTSSKPYMQKNFEMNTLYWKLYQKYNELGLFTPSTWWIVKVHILQAIIFAVLCHCCYYYPKNWLFNGIICGNFMLSGAFITHDACHSYTATSRSINKVISWINGDVIFGVSYRWWYIEHNQHHAMPNTYSEEHGKNIDPQASEDIWVQADEIFGYFKAFYHPFLIPYQHIICYPMALFVGKFGIMVDCWIPQILERRYKHIFGLILHWTYILTLCHLMENSWKFYFTLHTYFGILTIQLITNHIAKPFREIEESKEMSFPKRQVEVNANFRCSRWLDWFFGGLHFHNEHHVFPRMPRYNLRLISYDIKKYMKDFDVPYDVDWFFNLVWKSVLHLREKGKLYVEFRKNGGSLLKKVD